MNFELLHFLGEESKEEKAFSSVWKTMWYKTSSTFYLSLICLTLFIQFLLFPSKNYNIVNQKTVSEIRDSVIIASQNKTIRDLIEIIKTKDTESINKNRK